MDAEGLSRAIAMSIQQDANIVISGGDLSDAAIAAIALLIISATKPVESDDRHVASVASPDCSCPSEVSV